MSNYKHDARFQELQFLTRFTQDRWVRVGYPRGGGTFERDKERQMVLWLIRHGMLNGPDVRGHPYDYVGTLEQQDLSEMQRLINSLLSSEEVSLEMGHPGRLRLAELQDQLKATRLREPFNILFDGRHVERDLSVALMNIRPDEPVSLAYLDMNGLKAFNEEGDHATGDAAIKAFFNAVDKAVTGLGDAYRKGGDEVVVIMPGTPLETARQRMCSALMALATEEVSVKSEPRRLTSACGLLSVTSPKAQAETELQRADHLQKKAKAASKLKDGSRCSALAVLDGTAQGETVELV